MANKSQGLFLNACGVQGCRDPRVLGTAYCHKHATIESRTHVSSGRAYWVFGALVAALSMWCIVNAFAISGLECSQVNFAADRLFTGAFVCVPEDSTLVQPGLGLFSSHASLNTSIVLALAGMALAAIAAMLLYAGTRNDRY